MKQIQLIVTVIVITVIHTCCYADCNCDDWMKEKGYCVDYIKTKIPTFPIPNNVVEIATLNNKEIAEVTVGDVAIFDLGRYWHFTYVEKVHREKQGNATAIDVSEMNFGGQLTFDEYSNKWSPTNVNEWKRAICCGVTDKYGQKSLRKNIPLNTIKQIWSPVMPAVERINGRHNNVIVDKVKEVINKYFYHTNSKL